MPSGRNGTHNAPRSKKSVREKENLGMWFLIDESDASEDVKFILRRIAEHIGMEMF